MSDTTLAGSARRATISRETIAGVVSREFHGNRSFYMILAVWLAYTAAVASLRQDGLADELVEYGGRAMRAALVLACAVVTAAAIKVLVTRPDRPLKALGVFLVAMLPAGALLRYAYGFAVLAILMAAFLHNKMLIPQMSPFAWDATFARWDKVLFGGYHPWQLLQPLLGYPLVTRILDYAYVGWVPGVFLFWSWTIASRKVSAELRRQYWTATILSWLLLGIVLATALSSAGPCFLPQLFPAQASDYAQLNAYLAELHEHFMLSSSLTKQQLLEVYHGASGGLGGISAMPSMHNAQALLFVVAAYRVSRGLGHLMLGYAVLIFVASILLAWHYAVDGIIGMAGAYAIWWAVGNFDRGLVGQP
jgi:hypothetical protein